jgi:hypothetical protein
MDGFLLSRSAYMPSLAVDEGSIRSPYVVMMPPRGMASASSAKKTPRLPSPTLLSRTTRGAEDAEGVGGVMMDSCDKPKR